MMFPLLWRFRSPAVALDRARDLEKNGQLERALEAAHVGLSKLRRTDGSGRENALVRERIEIASSLQGRLLFALGRKAEALDALVEGRGRGIDGALRTFLADGLLDRAVPGPEAMDFLVEYVAHPPADEPLDATNDRTARLEHHLRPGPAAAWGEAELLRWNETLAVARPELAWPHLHLGTILAARGDLAAATTPLEKALAIDASPRTHALLCYVLAHSTERQSAVPSAPAGPVTRATALLRAHACRERGDAVGAAEWFGRADEQEPLDANTLCAYAEALVNAQQPASARAVLARIPDQAAPRWILLAAAAAESATQGAALLGRIVTDPSFGKQATARLTHLVAHTPRDVGARAALDAVPAAYRDDVYWIVASNVRRFAGDFTGAFDALRRVRRQNAISRAAVSRLGRLYLEHLYNAGKYRLLLRIVRRDLQPLDSADGLEPLVAGALTTLLRLRVRASRSRARVALRAVEAAQARLPELARRGDVQLVRGAVLALGHDFAGATEAFSRAGRNDLDGPAVQLQRARCALLAGDTGTCAAVLARLDPQHRSVARLLAAHSAVAGEWDVALRHLDASVPMDADSVYEAALAFLANRVDRFDTRARVDPHFSYFAAAAAARAADLSQAEALLAGVPGGHRAFGAAVRLRAWLNLQLSVTRLGKGDTEGFVDGLSRALEGWPDHPILAGVLPRLHARLLPAYIAAGKRPQMLLGFEQLDSENVTSFAESCHNRALFELSRSAEQARAADWESAFASFETCIAHLCVSLADDDYLNNWIARRLSSYGAALEVQPTLLRGKVVDLVRGVLHRWDAAGGGTLPTAYHTRPTELELLLRSELAATQALRHAGGFVPPDGSNGPLAVGPVFLQLMGWERAFAAYVENLEADLEPVHGGGDDALALLMRHFAQLASDAPLRRRNLESIRRLYSALRFIAVLEADGQYEQAITWLRARPWRCLPLHRNQRCASQTDGVCAPHAPNFNSCNPAFATPAGFARFAREANAMEIALLLKLGELEISAPEARVESGIEHWRQALEASGDSRSTTEEKIREIAIGRSRVLDERDHEEQAIRLLAAVNGLCGNDTIVGELALMHSHLAVRTFNEDGDARVCVERLRHALTLNQHSTRIAMNLMHALIAWSHEIFEADPAAGEALLVEAEKLGHQFVLQDPHNKELEELLQLVRRGLLVVRTTRGTATFHDMAASVDPVRASTFFHNRGVEHLRAGRLDEALADLTRALELEPASDVTRSALDAVRQQRMLRFISRLS